MNEVVQNNPPMLTEAELDQQRADKIAQRFAEGFVLDRFFQYPMPESEVRIVQSSDGSLNSHRLPRPLTHSEQAEFRRGREILDKLRRKYGHDNVGVATPDEEFAADHGRKTNPGLVAFLIRPSQSR